MTYTKGNLKRLILVTMQRILRTGVNMPATEHFAWKLVPIIRKFLSSDEEILTVYDENIKIWVRLSDHIESQIFWQGVQEGDRGEVKLLKKLLMPHYVFIDVGANVGVFSMMAAKRLRSGQVHAFEPIGLHIKRFQRNILVNGFTNIALNHIALSNKPSRIIMYIPKTANTGMTSCYPQRGLDYVEESVEATTLDNYVLQQDLNRVDVIKIDVEGAELDVLEGSIRMLEKFHPQLVIEADKDHTERAGRTLKDLLKFLENLGYNIYRIHHNGTLSPIHDVQDLSWHQNIYCYQAGAS